MKKDYSKRTFISTFGLSLPNFIGYVISLIFSIIIIKFFNITNELYMFLIIGLFESFVGLEIGGRLLNKYCANYDYKCCQNCKNWNCRRNIKHEK